MRVAVLGANSFSGTAFAQHMDSGGHQVLRLNRPVFDLNINIDGIVAAVAEFRPQWFVNFAALNMVGESWAHYQDYYRTNVIGVANLVAALRQMPWIEKFVQVSTPEVYGTTETFIKEGAPFRPSTPYAVSRAAADLHLEAVHRAYGFPVCFTRSVNVYGPAQQPYRIIPKTVLAILRGQKLRLHGGGVSTRSFIHIDDVAQAIELVAARGVPGETYHVATPNQTSIRDLVRSVCELMGANFDQVVELDSERLGKDMAYQLDDAKIRDELGWTPRIELADGLRQSVDWFRKHADSLAGRPLEYEHRA